MIRPSFSCFILLFSLPSVSIASAGERFEIPKHALSAGGGHSEGNSFKLQGSIGQKDASNFSEGTSFRSNGGFWTNELIGDIIFQHGFEEEPNNNKQQLPARYKEESP